MSRESVPAVHRRQLKLFRLRPRLAPSEPPPPPMRPLSISACFLLSCAALEAEPPDLAPVKKWIARQDEFRSVQADFTQTRALRALRSPVAAPGRIWFSAPHSLRWELGNPAKTIVLRKGDIYW